MEKEFCADVIEKFRATRASVLHIHGRRMWALKYAFQSRGSATLAQGADVSAEDHFLLRELFNARRSLGQSLCSSDLYRSQFGMITVASPYPQYIVRPSLSCAAFSTVAIPSRLLNSSMNSAR